MNTLNVTIDADVLDREMPGWRQDIKEFLFLGERWRVAAWEETRRVFIDTAVEVVSTRRVTLTAQRLRPI